MTASNSDLREEFVAWADLYANEILAAPRMWGSGEAVEMQVILLLEVRARALKQDPRLVADLYAKFLRERYPTQPSLPLFSLAQTESEFVEVLREFQARMIQL